MNEYIMFTFICTGSQGTKDFGHYSLVKPQEVMIDKESIAPCYHMETEEKELQK